MEKSEQELLANYRKRIKRQNDKVKRESDKITAVLPKGTKKRIKALGLTINDVINQSVLTYLDCIEESQGEEQEEPAEPTQEPEQMPETEPEPQQVTIEPVPAVKNGDFSKCQTLEEMQAVIDARNAEKARLAEEKEEQRKAENTAEIMEILESMRENKDAENEENEGTEFQESENSGSGDPENADCPF